MCIVAKDKFSCLTVNESSWKNSTESWMDNFVLLFLVSCFSSVPPRPQQWTSSPWRWFQPGACQKKPVKAENDFCWGINCQENKTGSVVDMFTWVYKRSTVFLYLYFKVYNENSSKLFEFAIYHDSVLDKLISYFFFKISYF